MIKIEYGKGYSDQTFEYKITIQKPMTVGEFIKEWITTAPNEWGYFGIYDEGTIFGNPKCEYSKGKIITDPIPDEYLNAEIDAVYGSGGWTRSDFIFKTSTRITPDPDVVKVVRCKDCAFCENPRYRGNAKVDDNIKFCCQGEEPFLVRDDWFCASGTTLEDING